MTVLVLTCEEDVTADLVVDQLGDRVVRIDPGHFPERVALSVTLQGGRITGTIETRTRRLRLQDIRSVWVRRPGKPGPAHGPQKAWSAHESDHALMGALRALPGIRWMNEPDAQSRARYKLTQLRLAHDVGLPTPSTLITTSARDAGAYVHGMQGVVCKTVSGCQPSNPPMALPTTHIDPGMDLEPVEGFPTCFQRAVHKAADIRLTVVGDQMFGARTFSGQGDWRYSRTARWSKARVPHSVASKVLALMKGLGLAYGAFDFAEDHEGRWWFLEVNPAGQFAFIEKETRLPVSTAITDWLLGVRPGDTVGERTP